MGSGLRSTYLIVSSLDGLAAALIDEDLKKAAHFLATSDDLRASAGLPRSSAEQSFYQPRIDVLKHQLTHEQQAEVLRERLTLEDAILAVQAAASAALE